MDISRAGAVGAVTTALLAGHLVAVVPATAAPPDRPATAVQQTHLVRAGTSNPLDAKTGKPSPESFVYTSYYPQHLQVHPGDTVRWEFTGGYGGWHNVTFLGPGGEPAHLVRHDETGMALNEPWLHGAPRDGSSEACGRASFWESSGIRDQPPCVLDAGSVDGPDDVLSSSVWDRFMSMPDSDCEGCASRDPDVGAAWVLTISEGMPTGRYEYFCRMHPHMKGVLEVVDRKRSLKNPTADDIEAQIRADYENAKATAKALSDPAHAYDSATRTWQVHVGADTADRRVEILEYLPPALGDVRRGDTVEFVARSQEPNTVLFHPGPSVGGRDVVHGGFSGTGRCGPSSCTTDAPEVGAQPVDDALDDRFAAVGPFYPTGAVGLAFPWGCDYDGPATGAPGVPIAPYVVPRMQGRTAPAGVSYGCIGGVVPEMTLAPWMAAPTTSPGGLITDGTLHSSGLLFDESVPDWYRQRPDGTPFPSRFTARFPTAGSFDFVCAAHESMRGTVTVS